MKKIFLGFLTALSICTSIHAENVSSNETTENEHSTVKVLVIGLHDNVSSNYFPESMITEETGIPEESIDSTYNQIITKNIIETNKDKHIVFIDSKGLDGIGNVINDITLTGNNEEQYADLSHIESKDYHNLLDNAHADYLLILNQHYLKWQEKPLRTLFHFVSYSLFDKSQQEITKGNSYFTCMNLEKADKLMKASKKSSSKIALSITKNIDK